MNEYNIYCDESCHLENDLSDIMLLGAVQCQKKDVKRIANKIKYLKKEYGIPASKEIKWTKVSPAKIDFYLKLLDFFYEENLNCRIVIAKGKKELDNITFKQEYDDWYYKMYYLLLSKMMNATEQYNVYVDIKDTCGGPKVTKLKNILNNFLYSFSATCLKKIQIVRSEEVLLLQMCDLLLGCVSYANRYMVGEAAPNSEAKVAMCQHLQELVHRPLNQSTPISEDKLNIFVWLPRK